MGAFAALWLLQMTFNIFSFIGLISDIIKQGYRRGKFKDMDPIVLHLMVMGGISYYRASGPIRNMYSAILEEPSNGTGDENVFDLLGKIERIIL